MRVKLFHGPQVRHALMSKVSRERVGIELEKMITGARVLYLN